MPDDSIELALGLTRRLTTFKRTIPSAKNYMDLDLDPYESNFAEQILVHIRKAERIHFNLTRMRMLNAPGGVLNGPFELNPRGSTNWELRTIWDDPILRAKTVFYQDDRILTEDEVQRLP
jgi:hypothetical protein